MLLFSRFIGRSQTRDGTGKHESWSSKWLRTSLLDDGSPAYDSEDGIFEFYTTSVYWAAMTSLTIGYGDLVPNTALEKLYTIFVSIISVLLTASIFGQMTTLVEMIDQRQPLS